MPRSPRRRAPGFVLPTTLLVLTLLTVMLTAAFVLVSAEFRTTDNSFGNLRALTLAEAGLQTYLSTDRGLADTSTYDSLRVTLTGGYADVVAQRLRAKTSTRRALWLVRSSAVSTTAVQSGQVQGRRVVAQLAELNTGALPAYAAVVAANPVVLTGGPGGGALIRGNDGCNANNHKYGLMLRAGDYTQEKGGSPVQGGTLSLGSQTEVLDSIGLDWSAIIAGDFAPDYDWPSYSANKVGLATADTLNLSFTGTRRGLLIVTGNLILTSGTWDGIMIVGGWVRLPAAGSKINGMLISGVNNRTAPNSVEPDSLQRGSLAIEWNSCNVAAALAGFAALVPVRGGWVDTWPSY